MFVTYCTEILRYMTEEEETSLSVPESELRWSKEHATHGLFGMGDHDLTGKSISSLRKPVCQATQFSPRSHRESHER